MEDTSYVSLSLEKYNELYDKAKKFDELTKQFGDEISDKLSNAFKGFTNALESITNKIEESAATNEEIDDEIKVGDKVRILENNYNAPEGDVGTIVAIKNNGCLQIEDSENKSIIWMLPDKKYVEKINEREEN